LLRALAGTCLAAALVSAPAMVAGSIAAGAPAATLAPAQSEPSSLPSATAASEFCLVAAAVDSQVNLTWVPSAPANGLAIYDAPLPDTGQPVEAGPATNESAQVANLTNGTTYSFWLAADGGKTVVSNRVSATPTAEEFLTAAPADTYCLAADAGDSQVRLTWIPPAQAPSAREDDVFVHERATSGPDTTVGPAIVDNQNTALVANLTNGTTYSFWLATGNSRTKLSNTVSNIVSATPMTVPGAPTGLIETPGNAGVTLSWAAPASDGGSPVTGYEIYAGTSPGGETGTPVDSSPVTATSYTAADLTNGTTYYFTVVAINAAGQGPPSGEEPATPVTVPGAPAGLTATPGNAQVTLSWAAPASTGGSPVTSYDIYTGTTADSSGGAPLATVTGTAVTVTGLVNGTTYYFKVTALNRVGEGAAAQMPAIPVTVPGAPTGLHATPGNARVTLSWTAPASTGGLPISGYIIYAGTSPDGETGALVNGSRVTATSYTVTGLTNGTTYYFKVAAINAAGLSSLSNEASATLLPIVQSTGPTSSTGTATGTAPATSTNPASSTAPATSSSTPSTTALGAPTGLGATAGDSRVRLSWTAPASDGGTSITTYKIYVASVPGLPGQAAGESGESTAATVTHLPNGTVYYFMVAAVDSAGKQGPLSTEVSAEPIGAAKGITVGLASSTTPTQLIALLAAVAAMVAAAAFTLITRRGRRPRPLAQAGSARTQARSHQQLAVTSDVRAVPDIARPDVLAVRDIGPEPTHTIRLEPHPGTATTTLKERRT
jgi:fibronectin type 3 domain-containing protein